MNRFPDGLWRRSARCQFGQLDLCFTQENISSADIESALRAVKHVLFKGFSQLGGQFVEEVALRRHFLLCLFMVHRLTLLSRPLRDGDPADINVSVLSRGNAGTDAPEIFGLELLLGPEKQNP